MELDGKKWSVAYVPLAAKCDKTLLSLRKSGSITLK